MATTSDDGVAEEGSAGKEDSNAARRFTSFRCNSASNLTASANFLFQYHYYYYNYHDDNK